MSTRSYICKLNENNGFIDTAIYCHYDGYPSYMMSILTTFYNTATKIDELLELGALSCIGASLEPSPLVRQYGFDWMNNSEYKALTTKQQDNLKKNHFENSCTIAYHRDRGEPLEIETNITVQNLVRNSGVDFIYIWYKNRWFYSNTTELENCSSPKLLELLNKELEC